MYEFLKICACVAVALVVIFALACGAGAFIAAGMYDDEEDKRGKGA